MAEALEGIETFLRRTSTEYEMFFLGIIRKPPTEKAIEIKRMFADLDKTEITNTRLQFRARVLRTRHNSYKMKWLRTVKQIEEGTYRRQRFMADQREKKQTKTPEQLRAESQYLRDEIKALAQGRPAPEKPPHMRADAKEQVDQAKTPSRAPATRGPKRGQGHAPSSKALFSEYVKVRKELGENASINRAALQKTLCKHADAIKARYKCKDVLFRIVVEDGKSRVKAIPIK